MLNFSPNSNAPTWRTRLTAVPSKRFTEMGMHALSSQKVYEQEIKGVLDQQNMLISCREIEWEDQWHSYVLISLCETIILTTNVQLYGLLSRYLF